MKQLVWILNSSLLILFLISQFLLFIVQKNLPRRVLINPIVNVVQNEKQLEPVRIETIYEHDLFDTYQMPMVTPVTSDETMAAMPKPPKNIPYQAPTEKAPVFFAPLEVLLKGVIFVKDNPASSLAIIQFKKTKEEQNYQVGDLIEDAQILKILPNRIIIIRSNGQQETLYLREEDAVHDFDLEVTFAPKNVIESSAGNKYKINIDEFVQRISTLGEFINALDISTVYKQGKSFGCRIGQISKDSLGAMLGFEQGDIIVNINNYPVDNLSNRLAIYDLITHMTSGDIIQVQVLRNDTSLTLLYGLVDYASKNIEFSAQDIEKQLKEEALIVKQDQNVVVQSQSYIAQNHSLDNVYNNIDSDDQIQEQFDTEIQSGFAPTHEVLEQIDQYEQKLSTEYNSLRPMIKNIRDQDKKNMLKQTHRNVILNGMA